MYKDQEAGKALKLAVMGGTFDPIHYGHLVAAEAVRAEFELDKVLFIPAGKPAHKLDKKVTCPEHRFAMTSLATESNPYFEASRIEIDRVGITYTIDTIKDLKARYMNKCDIYFITGADALLDILSWKNVEELFGLCSFVAATRPGFDYSEIKGQLDDIERRFNKKIRYIEVPSLAISSSDIRDRVKCGKPIKYLLPESTEAYIKRNSLYEE